MHVGPRGGKEVKFFLKKSTSSLKGGRLILITLNLIFIYISIRKYRYAYFYVPFDFNDFVKIIIFKEYTHMYDFSIFHNIMKSIICENGLVEFI